MMDTNSQTAVLSLVSYFICVLSSASPDDVVEDMLLQFFLYLSELQLLQTEASLLLVEKFILKLFEM